ncbi:hypothetical protein TRFO_42523 [Tritrichomonas foetus]|uniref:Integral membrane protein n=1 Tax=Tritrichomonas foetus TaxID=1144522 RepID=A0A1J4KX04_9EUKA|nr:hypothetical protein TRFO_42523 [Tritrichomonas foetus]|eukprot:OHT15416.1 hypothetical protein TRFO_42523 [Tritrichomonas foetus]
MSDRSEASCLKKTIALTTFFVCGAFSSVLSNILYCMESKGLHNIVKPFRKPWFQVWGMFVAMTLLIFNTSFIKTCKCQKYKIGDPICGIGLFRIVSLPALCDNMATILSTVALLYLAPSIWQMMRGSALIFTAIFTIFYRHRRLNLVDWIGVSITVLGLVIIGVSSLVATKKGVGNSGSSVILQIISFVLILVAQALQAFQCILEEEFLHDIDATESEIVAYEGVWGLFITSFIMMPLANIIPESWGEGLFEQSIESFVMVAHSWQIFLLMIFYIIVIAGFNQAGMTVIEFSSAIHKNIYEALRSIAVWVLSVIVHYIWPSSEAGESITMMSLVQLAGFIVMIIGSFIYNRVIPLKCLEKDNIEETTKTDFDQPLNPDLM